MTAPGSPHAAKRGWRASCAICGTTADVHYSAPRYLCSSCEYRESKPDAAAAVKMPRDRRALPLQSERQF